MIDLQQNTLLREIPPNLLVDDKVVHLAKVLQMSLSDMLEWAYKINYKMNLELLDDAILDHLLWENHITWDEGLVFATTKEQKINLIRSAVGLHRTKGTPAAIEKVLEALNLPGEVIEWFQYSGDPYHFIVEIEITVIKEDTLNWLNRLINTFKNVRSWLEAIHILFPKMQLNLKEFQWIYPVLYPIAGHWSEGIKGAALETAFSMNSAPYDYPVLYPIAADHYLEGQKGLVFESEQSLASEPFAYSVKYPASAAHDSEGIKGSGMSDKSAMLAHQVATITNPYPVCGEFYGGGY